jgi:hypothetical protein
MAVDDGCQQSLAREMPLMPSTQVSVNSLIFIGHPRSHFKGFRILSLLTRFKLNPPKMKSSNMNFVVIKEACGNLFAAVLFSIPAWLLIAVKQYFSARIKPRYWVMPKALACVAYLVTGLYRMHDQHVHRQTQFAKDLVLERMVTPGSKFTRKMEEAIAALLVQRNIEDAAKAAGIGTQTLLRWLKVPEFDKAYREARRATFAQSTARLQQATSAAVSTLSEDHGRSEHTALYPCARRQ